MFTLRRKVIRVIDPIGRQVVQSTTDGSKLDLREEGEKRGPSLEDTARTLLLRLG